MHHSSRSTCVKKERIQDELRDFVDTAATSTRDPITPSHPSHSPLIFRFTPTNSLYGWCSRNHHDFLPLSIHRPIPVSFALSGRQNAWLNIAAPTVSMRRRDAQWNDDGAFHIRSVPRCWRKGHTDRSNWTKNTKLLNFTLNYSNFMNINFFPMCNINPLFRNLG